MGFLIKVLGRMAFFSVCLLAVPLTVMNRQTVTLRLNPFEFLDGAAATAITLPLFVLVLMIFVIGLLVGYGLARLAGARKNRTSRTARRLPPLPTVVKQPSTQTGDSAEGSGSAAARQALAQLAADPAKDD